MSNLNAVILGVVQALTEFLPVSSSGHLVLFQHLLGIKEPMLVFDIAVHWGTLLAVILYFWRDILHLIRDFFNFITRLPSAPDREKLFQEYPYALVGVYVIVATIPTALIGFFFQEVFENLFHSVFAVAVAWFALGILLIISERFQDGDRNLTMLNQKDAFLIGTAQGIAILPGISRSGTTILMGMLCGIKKEDAARFSFLMSLPAILGVGILKFKDGIEFAQSSMAPLLIGFFVSAIVGCFAIAVLLKLIQKGKFYMFGYYCVVMSVGTFAYIYLSGLLR